MSVYDKFVDRWKRKKEFLIRISAELQNNIIQHQALLTQFKSLNMRFVDVLNECKHDSGLMKYYALQYFAMILFFFDEMLFLEKGRLINPYQTKKYLNEEFLVSATVKADYFNCSDIRARDKPNYVPVRLYSVSLLGVKYWRDTYKQELELELLKMKV